MWCFQISLVSAPTTTILPTTACTHHGWNWFGHVIYVPQTSSYQNITKHLTNLSIITNIDIFFFRRCFVLVIVYIFGMRCFPWLCFSDWLPHLGCFFHNVSAVWSSGLLQVYLELGNSGISKFQSSRVRDKPEEGRRIRRPKRCGKNNLDEEVSPKSIINALFCLLFWEFENRFRIWYVTWWAIVH